MPTANRAIYTYNKKINNKNTKHVTKQGGTRLVDLNLWRSCYREHTFKIHENTFARCFPISQTIPSL